MRLSLVLLSIVIVLEFGRLAYSKCAMDRYVITGRIRDCRSKSPLRDATVLVFFDDDEESYGPVTVFCKTPRQTSNEYWRSSTDGHFEITGYFDTLKDPHAPLGPNGEHDCSKVATKLQLVVVKAGYYSTRREFTKLKIVERGMIERFIEVPEMCVEPRRTPR